MYDTSPPGFSKTDSRALLHVDIYDKTLEWFDLHPSLENSFDLTDFVASAVSEGAQQASGVDSDLDAVVASSQSTVEFITLSGAATSQHLAEIERQPEPATTTSSSNLVGSFIVSHSTTPVPTSTATALFLHHQQHHSHQAALASYLQPISPEEVSQTLSDDSCVFMPEYEQLNTPTTSVTTNPLGAGWTPGSFCPTIKTEDLGSACSLEPSLPVFTNTVTTSAASAVTSTTATTEDVKMEVSSFGDNSGRYSRCAAYRAGFSPATSTRSLSESSNATTTTTNPDSPRQSLSKGGAKRRNVPKGTVEYKEKRARNNVAVRKSRAKAKEKQRQTEDRVRQLSEHNEQLQKKVEMLTKELTVLRGLFVNVGAPLPDDFTKLLEQTS